MILIQNTVKQITFGDSSSYQNGLLTVSKEELSAAALKNTDGKYAFDIDVCYPGEKTRIVHITDAIKPSYKPDAAAFPGWTEGENKCGQGETVQLENLCLLQTFAYPGIQEGIVDMSGVGAKYSLFSKKINLVMSVKLLDTAIEKPVLAKDLVRMQTQAAEYLASIAKDACEKKVEINNPQPSSLPRVGYAYFVQAQGPLRNVFMYGKECVNMKATYLSPAEIIDGALVSGNYIIACQKNPTIYHQENPVIRYGIANSGKEMDFVGAICATESNLLDGKRESAASITQKALELHCDGMIITQEGGGHADVDLIFTNDALTDAGIRTVVIANEIAGPDGILPPLVSFSSKVDATISTGNNDQVIELDAMDKSIGGDAISNGAHNATDSFKTPLGIMYTATNQLGVSNMTTKSY